MTTYTDYTLRVMMYLAVKYNSGELSTIDHIVNAYRISRAHVAKIVHDLAQSGMIATTRGRHGGICLMRSPATISIGDLVRLCEPDFTVVECHEPNVEITCAISAACNLRQGFRRALNAFMLELDGITLASAISSHGVAAKALGMPQIRPIALPVSRKKNKGMRMASQRSIMDSKGADKEG